MPIPNNVMGSDKDVFYTDRFKTLVRSERELLRKTANSQPILELNKLYAYRNDFYRLLRNYNIQPYLYWATAFINGIEDPSQDITHLTSFLTINEESLASAISRSNTVRG